MTRKLTTRDGWWTFRDAIANGEAFTTHGALFGGPDAAWGSLTGQLPREYHASAARADYTVWSYATPIAWRDRVTGEWTVPDVKYSVTTSRHQGRIRPAIANL